MNEGFGGLQPKRVVGKARAGHHGGQALGAQGTEEVEKKDLAWAKLRP